LALRDFKFIRIEATVFKNNTPSKRVLEKAGFMPEGTLQKFYNKDQKFIDADIYARLI